MSYYQINENAALWDLSDWRTPEVCPDTPLETRKASEWAKDALNFIAELQPIVGLEDIAERLSEMLGIQGEEARESLAEADPAAPRGFAVDFVTYTRR